MIRLKGSSLFATFSDEELKKHIESHNAEEKRMLWLGVMLGQNNLLQKIDKNYNVYIGDK
tara:strand:- start:283 stop:462 length:180 start_codon:yes stop_codon:yes gene_type:complete